MTRAPLGVFDQWAPRLLAFSIFAVPLVFALNLNDTFDLPKITAVYTLAMALSVLWGWQRFSSVVVKQYSSPVTIPLLIFLACTAISVVGSIEPWLSLLGAYRIYVFGFFPLVALAILWWMSLQVDFGNRVKTLSWCAFASGVFVGGYALLQYTGYEIFDRMPPVVHGRPWASLGNPLYMGALCMMALPLAQALWDDKWWPRFLVVVGTFFILMGLVLSLSRSAWTGAVVGCGVTGFLLWRNRSLSSRATHWMPLIVIGVGIVLGLGFAPVRDRAAVLFSAHEGSNSARVEGWKAGLNVWAHHPWFGTGADTFNRSFREYRSLAYVHAAGATVTQADAHNDFVQIAATEGTVGLVSVIVLIVVGLIAMFRRLAVEMTPWHAGLAGSVISLWVQDQFNFSSVSTALWGVVFMGILLHRRESFTERPASPMTLARFGSLLVGIVAMAVVIRPVMADWNYRQGSVALQSNQPLIADEHYRVATSLAPSRSEYQTGRANLCRDVGQAIQGDSRMTWLSTGWGIAQADTRRHPADPDSWNNLGVADMWMTQLAGVDHRQDAYEAFQKAVRLDPFFMDAWANLARWQHLAGRLDLERTLWEKVLLIDPTQPFARQVLGLAPTP